MTSRVLVNISCVINIRRAKYFACYIYSSCKIFRVFNFRRKGSSTKISRSTVYTVELPNNVEIVIGHLSLSMLSLLRSEDQFDP